MDVACIKEVDVAAVMSPISLWTTILKHQVLHFGRHHFVLLEPEVMTFEQEGGPGQEQKVDLTENPKTLCTVATCQPKLNHTLLYDLFFIKWDYNLKNEH